MAVWTILLFSTLTASHPTFTPKQFVLGSENHLSDLADELRESGIIEFHGDLLYNYRLGLKALKAFFRSFPMSQCSEVLKRSLAHMELETAASTPANLGLKSCPPKIVAAEKFVVQALTAAVAAVAEAMDFSENIYLKNGEMEFDSLQSIQKLGSSLTHFHKYSKIGGEGEKWVVPFHVDRGLLLALSPEEGLLIRTEEGEFEVQASPNNIIILNGGGLSHFLGLRSFPPVAHAVSKMAQDFRFVVAHMLLPPMNSSNFAATKFGDFFMEKETLKDEVASQWRKLAEESCGENEKWCWMQCLAAKDCATSASICWDSATNDFCPPDRLSHTCHLRCPAGASPATLKNEFCNGAVSMHMTGFEWGGEQDRPCTIFLFQEWALDKRWKFALAAIGTFVMGISVEFLAALRRKVPAWNLSRYLADALVTFLFGVNLFFAYVLMLIVMTFSIELFIVAIVGLMSGFYIFNRKNLAASADLCCRPEELVEAPISQKPEDVENTSSSA